MLDEFYRNPSVERHNFDFETGRSVISADSHTLFLIRQVTNNLYEQVDKALPKLRTEIENPEKSSSDAFQDGTLSRWSRWTRKRTHAGSGAYGVGSAGGT